MLMLMLMMLMLMLMLMMPMLMLMLLVKKDDVPLLYPRQSASFVLRSPLCIHRNIPRNA
jgi:hypothetical protein